MMKESEKGSISSLIRSSLPVANDPVDVACHNVAVGSSSSTKLIALLMPKE